MSYTPNIPVSGDTLGGTRDRINSNFTLIKSVFGKEHWTFGESDQGLHKRIVMPEVTTSGSGIPGTNPNEAALYTDPDPTNSVSNWWMRAENNGKHYQLTNVNDAQITTFGTYTPYDGNNEGGWTFLPGGLFFFYGQKQNPNVTGTVTFPFPFPSGVNPYSLVVTVKYSSTNPFSVTNITPSGFDYKITTNPSSLYWQAIGK